MSGSQKGEPGWYNSFVGYYRKTYGERLQKLVVDAGFTCPNRDGTVGRGGCTYCDNAAFHPGYSSPDKSIIRQMDEGIEFHRRRYPRVRHYLAYFQAYSNTYGPLEKLRSVYEEALKHPLAAGIVIGTRPDCVDAEKLDYLKALHEGKILEGWSRELKNGTINSPVVEIEYGIESCYDETLKRINRGHDFECARKAVEETAARGLDTGAHFILGLPGESREMMLDSCRIINSLPLRSVKFHQLQFVKGTVMARQYDENPEDFMRLELPDYIDFMVDILERLRPDLYVERIAGEVPPRFLSSTQWGLLRNEDLIRLLEKRLIERATFQGRLYEP
jgi:radical SAM protein (TIGR01212 family)